MVLNACMHELKQLEKQFPNEQVVFVCEDCLSKFPTLDH
jgi:hypothetical protein